MRICHSCGAEAHDDSRFCASCGEPLNRDESASPHPYAHKIKTADKIFAFVKAYVCTLLFKVFSSVVVNAIVIVGSVAGLLILGNADVFYTWCTSPDGGSVLSAIIYFLFIGATIVIIRVRKRSVKEELGLKRAPLTSIPIAALFGYTGNLVYMVALNLIPWPKSVIDSHTEAYGDIGAEGSSLVLTVIVIAVLTGIIEEIVFRALVMLRLRRAFSPIVSVILSALFFAAAHPTVFSFVYTFILGTLLAAIYNRYESVFPCIAVHVFFNLAACIGYPESAVFFAAAIPLCAAAHVICGILLLKRSRLSTAIK